MSSFVVQIVLLSQCCGVPNTVPAARIKGLEAHYHNFHYQMCRSWSYSKSYSELWERAKGHIQWALRESKGSYVVSSTGAGGQTSEPVCAKMYVHFGLKGAFSQNCIKLKMLSSKRGYVFDSLK